MSRFTTCGLTILLAFAPAALAVDGTVLINQSTITNGLTGCPTGGHLPIVICQSGSYRLSGNVTVPDANTSAIQISADNVTLDLNGFSILGPVGCGGNPVTCTQGSAAAVGIGNLFGNSNITVSNGTIRGLGGYGILLSGSGILIERVKAANNGIDGINVSKTQDTIITLCHAIDNGGSGFVGSGALSNSSALNNGAGGMNWDGTVTGSISAFNGGKAFEGLGVFIANYAIGAGGGINTLDPSVIISNVVLFASGVPISAPSGSVVLNNVAQ
jgi:hypothetical protein